MQKTVLLPCHIQQPGQVLPKACYHAVIQYLAAAFATFKNLRVGSLPRIMISKVNLMRGIQSLQRKPAGRLKLGSKCYLWLP